MQQTRWRTSTLWTYWKLLQNSPLTREHSYIYEITINIFFSYIVSYAFWPSHFILMDFMTTIVAEVWQWNWVSRDWKGADWTCVKLEFRNERKYKYRQNIRYQTWVSPEKGPSTFADCYTWNYFTKKACIVLDVQFRVFDSIFMYLNILLNVWNKWLSQNLNNIVFVKLGGMFLILVNTGGSLRNWV